MTENEAIEWIRAISVTQKESNHTSSLQIRKEALYMAIQALEKIQAYREIGTIEEFKALKEKAEPYKPQEYEDKYYGCKCGEVLLEKWEEYPKKLMPKSWGLPYCLGCGQKLDWS